ncbi:aldose epimerase family protein [Spiroplasma taiwanense]|uniref:Aldose 1-epimerase family protein n=1 Tax=Spiroplasma taiwanense CT-1 TaxID=1276220 RepID=S5LWE3_9MOLU|nr:aldose 1-epimerase [Spiroplasma taiwanense]AGR40941.1 aldose 1-epimerase family protein [Spiroplasma taiwanense CT-1]
MLVLEKDNIKILVSINPFEIKSIKFENKEILYQQENNWKKTWPILFPICGTLKSNLKVDGKEIFLKRHGFFNEIIDWKILEHSQKGILTEFISKDKLINQFPYKFKILLDLQIINNQINFDITIENIDNKKMFFSFGHHPGFIINDNTEIIFNKKQQYCSDFKRGLIISKQSNFFEIEKLNKNDLSFKNSDSYLVRENNCDRVSIKNDFVEYELIFENYKSLILWSESNEANFLCIEPWNGLPDFEEKKSDELKDKEGILKLEVNEIKKFEYKIIFKNGEQN